MPTPVLDHTQDLSGTEQHRLTSLYPPPAFVKEASHDRLYGNPEQIPAHAYADSTSRRFPCHSAPATWMSALFFFDKQAGIPPARAKLIGERIEAAARYFNIGQIVGDLKQKVAADAHDDLKQLPDSEFALVWVEDSGNGHKERHYPLRNAEEVKTAAAWFTRFRGDFTFYDRQQIAHKIVEKAAAYRVPLDEAEMLNRTAGYGYCAGVKIAEMLEQRGNLVARSHPQHAAEIRKLARLVRAHPHDVRDHGCRVKVAAVVDMFDRDTKLTRMYDDGLDRPEEVLFAVTEKAAGDFMDAHVQMTSGTIYEKSAFEALDHEVVARWMGTELADEVCSGTQVDPEKLATIAATLPRPDAEMFDRMAASAGVSVFARDKAAHARGLGLNELIELANMHEHEFALEGIHPT